MLHLTICHDASPEVKLIIVFPLYLVNAIRKFPEWVVESVVYFKSLEAPLFRLISNLIIRKDCRTIQF